MRPIILHLSNDYPDVLVSRKTKAVANIVEGTPQYRHIVYSLNRVSALSGIASLVFGDDKTAVAYGALPKGVFWERRLKTLAQWIIADIKNQGIQPDIVQAHKFTIEGLVGQDVSREFKCPLVCDIQGYTDINILHRKKAYHRRYREIAEQASAIFPYAPWPLSEFEKEIGLVPQKCYFLPVIPSVDVMQAAPIISENCLLSVFHLDGWRNKNFEGMIFAVKKLRHSARPVKLDVYGSGSPRTLLHLQRIIDAQGMHDYVRLMGAVENEKMLGVMQRYAGFIMPSKSESYGLVYVESLFAGVPVLFNEKRGIAGYFEPSDIGYGCDAQSVDDIAHGIMHLIQNQKHLKENIAQMQKRGAFDFMRRHAILKTYAGVIDSVLAKR